jgi:hypothetical protein
MSFVGSCFNVCLLLQCVFVLRALNVFADLAERSLPAIGDLYEAKNLYESVEMLYSEPHLIATQLRRQMTANGGAALSSPRMLRTSGSTFRRQVGRSRARSQPAAAIPDYPQDTPGRSMVHLIKKSQLPTLPSLRAIAELRHSATQRSAGGPAPAGRSRGTCAPRTGSARSVRPELGRGFRAGVAAGMPPPHPNPLRCRARVSGRLRRGQRTTGPGTKSESFGGCCHNSERPC